MKRTLLYALAVSAVVSTSCAQAHFIWLVPETSQDGTSVINVYFGEDATDDGTEFLSRLQGIKLHRVTGSEAATELIPSLSDSGLSATADLSGNTVVVTSHDLGVMDRGDSVFRLKYYAKAGPVVTDSAWKKAATTDDVRLDIVPSWKDGKVRIKVRFDEKPVAGAQVKAARPGMEDFEGETNDKGVAVFPIAEGGVHSIRVRHIETAPGELKGKKYPETRHYSTLAVSIPASGPSAAATTSLQPLPQPVTSFGAAVVKDSLYMYGGHTGSAHSYSKQEQSNHLTRLDLKSGQWSTIIDGPHLQGLALVTYQGKLYRVGGFTAQNAEGEDHDLWSQDNVACFDPTKDAWEDLPPLPERRSSHDAAVVDGSIYVVGGWAMGGEKEHQWHTTGWKMDLTAKELRWEAIAAPPFQRRALALAAHEGRLYVVGGMQKDGGPTTAVGIYDPKSNSWSEGPSLVVKADPEPKDGEKKSRRSMSSGRMAGFGASAFATGGSLYVTTVQGNLQQLSPDGSKWEIAASDLTPRFFHRLLPLDDGHLIVVGGSNMSIGKFDEVEVISVRRGT